MANDTQTVTLGLSVAFPIVAIASVIFRFEARRIKRLKLGADDWTILAALFLDIAVTVDVLIDFRLGNLGGHENLNGNPVSNRQHTIFGQTTYVFELLVWPCVGLTKISVLLLYKRIFATRTFRILVWCSIGLVVAWTVAMELASMLYCLPISSRWIPDEEYTCVNEIAFFTAALSTDVITDGLILLLPIYNVWKLQMPVQRKLAVIGIFALGALVTITGIIRLHFLALSYGAFPFRPSSFSLSYASIFSWSIIETNVGILSACLPTLRPLYEGYRIKSVVSKLSSLSTASRSTAQFRDNIRLSSVEHGFSDNVGKVPRSYTSDPYTVYDELDPPVQKPRVIPYPKSDQAWRSSEMYN